MGELGEESERGHREVGEAAAALGIDELIAVGATGAAIARAAQKAGLEKSIAGRMRRRKRPSSSEKLPRRAI